MDNWDDYIVLATNVNLDMLNCRFSLLWFARVYFSLDLDCYQQVKFGKHQGGKWTPSKVSVLFFLYF